MLGRHRVLNYIAGATAALVLAAGSAVAATNTYKFAFVTPNSPNDPYARSGQELAKALEEANAANAASEVALQRAKRNLETEHRKGVEAAAKLLRRVRSLCYHTGPHTTASAW